MIIELNDEQISLSIKAVLALIITLGLWFSVSFLYQNYYKNDTKTESEIQKANQLIKKSPTDIRKRVALADLLLNKNRMGDAIKNYKEALKLNDKYEPALLGLGIAYQKNGDTDKAIEIFDKEIRIGTSGTNSAIDKYLEQAYFYKGQLLLEEESYKEAAQLLEKALEIAPTMGDTHLLLGKTKKKLGLKQEAKIHFKKALKLNTKSVEAKEELKKIGN